MMEIQRSGAVAGARTELWGGWQGRLSRVSTDRLYVGETLMKGPKLKTGGCRRCLRVCGVGWLISGHGRMEEWIDGEGRGPEREKRRSA